MRGDVTARLKNVSILCVRSHFCRSKQWRLTVCPLHIYFSNVSTGHILPVSSHRQPPNAKYFQIISWISVTPAYLNLLFFFHQLSTSLFFFLPRRLKKMMAPIDPGSGKSWDLSCRFHSWLFSRGGGQGVRLLVCLFAKLCGIFFLFAFVSSLCTTVSIRIYHHSTLCLFEMKARWGGSGFLFSVQMCYLPAQTTQSELNEGYFWSV